MPAITGLLSRAYSIQELDPDQAAVMFEDDVVEAPAWSRAIAAWVNMDPRVRMLLSRSGRIHWANEAACRMLKEGGAGFRAVNDILVAENGQIGSTLGRLLADAPMDAALFAMTSTGSDPQWLLWAQQLIPDDEASIGFAAHRTADPVSYGAMLQLHHLTPCETQIVTMMLAGVETGRIAQRQDISIETLRTHIKHAYGKLEVKSRGELFAKAVDFARL